MESKVFVHCSSIFLIPVTSMSDQIQLTRIHLLRPSSVYSKGKKREAERMNDHPR